MRLNKYPWSDWIVYAVFGVFLVYVLVDMFRIPANPPDRGPKIEFPSQR